MKIKILLFLVFAVSMSVVLSSYRNGAATRAFDGTGATGVSGCTNGGGCHNAATALGTIVELDSAGVAVTSYRPGGSYTVKISATNGTGGTYGSFGFQLAVILATGTSPTATGTWGTSLPTNVRYTAGAGRQIGVIEQSSAITATSGSGGAGTVYSESIPWTAPIAGTGSIQIYGIINAVTGLDIAFLTNYQTATPVTITEALPAGINELADKLSSFNVYPTLMNDHMTVAFDLKESSAVSITLISLQGQEIKNLMSQETLGQGAFKRSFDVNGLTQGIYLVRLQIGNSSVVSKVVKE
jgi:hypothetical protein